MKGKLLKYRSIGRETRAPLFVSFIKPHAPVSSTTISRWIKSVLALAGVDTALFQGHSVGMPKMLAGSFFLFANEN